jgi:hypothetical protein
MIRKKNYGVGVRERVRTAGQSGTNDASTRAAIFAVRDIHSGGIRVAPARMLEDS